MQENTNLERGSKSPWFKKVELTKSTTLIFREIYSAYIYYMVIRGYYTG